MVCVQIIPNKGFMVRESVYKAKSPGGFRGFCSLSIQYSESCITHTPRKSSGLARVFIDWGLDRFFGGGLNRLAVGAGDPVTAFGGLFPRELAHSLRNDTG